MCFSTNESVQSECAAYDPSTRARQNATYLRYMVLVGRNIALDVCVRHRLDGSATVSLSRGKQTLLSHLTVRTEYVFLNRITYVRMLFDRIVAPRVIYVLKASVVINFVDGQ